MVYVWDNLYLSGFKLGGFNNIIFFKMWVWRWVWLMFFVNVLFDRGSDWIGEVEFVVLLNLVV